MEQRIKKQTQTSHSDGFDILKCICAFLIVCIHAPFPGICGEYFNSLCSIAVPVFFMITGFFYQNIVDHHREIKQIKKITIIFISSNLLYFIFNTLIAIISGSGVIGYFKNTFTIRALLKLLVLNESPFGGHLWYLGAILYVLIIAVFVRRFKLMKLLLILTPLLLIGDLTLGKYSIILLNREFPFIISRNFLFVGIPYFCIGFLINKYKNIIDKKFFGKKAVLSICIVLFSVTILLEKYLLITYNLNAPREHYISTTLLACSVFILFMITYHRKLTTFERIAARIGREYSALIYIVHPIFMTVLLSVFEKVGLTSVYTYTMPIVVYICTVAGVAVYKQLQVKAGLFKEKSRRKQSI